MLLAVGWAHFGASFASARGRAVSVHCKIDPSTHFYVRNHFTQPARRPRSCGLLVPYMPLARKIKLKTGGCQPRRCESLV